METKKVVLLVTKLHWVIFNWLQINSYNIDKKQYKYEVRGNQIDNILLWN